MKNILLIRHGESRGQTARDNGINRQKDPVLTDCFLSPRGVNQAFNLRQEITDMHNQMKFDLVCVSPLTRAIATCVLGLGHLSETCAMMEDDETMSEESASIPFICHPDLAETGGRIPENIGRPLKQVKKDIKKNLNHISPSYAAVDSIDFSLVPSSWPNRSQGYVQYFMEWLSQRPEQNIVVVCHHNIILSLLGYRIDRVSNCVPIRCVMNDGDVRMLHLESDFTESTPSKSLNSYSSGCKKKGKNRRGRR